jgi:organic radical activating enzyme
VEHLKSMGVNMVVVSGGEPLLQDLGPLIVACRRHGWRVEVETNGTLIPQDKDNLPDQFNVSPKLSHAGDLAHRRIVPEALQWLNASQRAIFKFVVQEVSHLEEVQALVAAHGLAPVYIMPEGITAEAVCRISTMLAKEVIRRGWNLTTRLHVLLWGAERGK